MANFIFPFTNLHELNLDWIVQQIKQQQTDLENFVALNSIKYAVPFQWDITSQYAQNTLVIDPQDGTAYLSIQPVPQGVQIENTDYWTPVFTLQNFTDALKAAICRSIPQQEDGQGATQTIPANSLFFVGNILCTNSAEIPNTSLVIIGSNCQQISVEELLANLSEQIAQETTDREEAISAEQSARERADTQLQNSINAERSAREAADTALGQQITEETEAREAAVTALGQQITAEQTAREQADEQLQTEIDGRLSVAPKHYSGHYRLYVDGVNGNDDNDGSSSAPFKTLDRFLQTCNQDMTDIRCYIVSAGTYVATLQVLQGMTLHITSTVPGVKIIWGSSDQEAFVWYNSHINFQGPTGSYIEMNCPYPYVYGDNCLFTFVRVKWDCGFYTYNGALDAKACSFYYGRFSKTMIDIYGGTAITATSDVIAYKFFLDQCQGRLTGAFTLPSDEPVSGDQQANSCLVTAQNSYYSLEFTPTIPANKAAYGLRASGCIIMITSSRLTACNNYGTNGNYLVSTLIVNDNDTLPAT